MSLLQLSRAQACAHRINEVLTARPSVEDKETAVRSDLPAPRGEVEFRDVSFKYNTTGSVTTCSPTSPSPRSPVR